MNYEFKDQWHLVNAEGYYLYLIYLIQKHIFSYRNYFVFLFPFDVIYLKTFFFFIIMLIQDYLFYIRDNNKRYIRASINLVCFLFKLKNYNDINEKSSFLFKLKLLK